MSQKRQIIKSVIYLFAGLSLLIGASAFAASSGSGTTAPASYAIGSLANNVKSSFSALAQLVTAISYVMGFGFVLMAIFKFKHHKDNPTQIQIGTPIALLFIGAAMIFLPSVIRSTGATVFGSKGSVGGVQGVYSISGLKTSGG